MYYEIPSNGPVRSFLADSAQSRASNGQSSPRSAEARAETKNLLYLLAHKGFFGLPNSILLDRFLELVRTSPNALIECSCKFVDRVPHPNRFYIWFRDGSNEAILKQLLDGAQRLEHSARVQLDRSAILNFCNSGFDYRRLSRIAAGIDLRPGVEHSRLKIYLIVQDYPEKVDQAISLSGEREEVRQLIVHGEFAVGFDLYCSGRTTVKAYPDLRSDELAIPEVKARLQSLFSPGVLEMIDSSRWIHFYFPPAGSERILHFHLASPEVLEGFQVDPVSRALNEYYRKLPVLDVVLSLRQSEIDRGDIQNYSIYYTL